MSRKAISSPNSLTDLSRSGPAAVRTFLNIAAVWGLTDEQISALMNVGEESLIQWRAGAIDFSNDGLLLRLSYVFGIYRALQILIPHRSDTWVLSPNAAKPFDGRAAISVMSEGLEGLRSVRCYLDTQLA